MIFLVAWKVSGYYFKAQISKDVNGVAAISLTFFNGYSQ